jgi:hypothetical protein
MKMENFLNVKYKINTSLVIRFMGINGSIANPLKTTIENLFSSEASCTLDEVVIKKIILQGKCNYLEINFRTTKAGSHVR